MYGTFDCADLGVWVFQFQKTEVIKSGTACTSPKDTTNLLQIAINITCDLSPIPSIATLPNQTTTINVFNNYPLPSFSFPTGLVGCGNIVSSQAVFGPPDLPACIVIDPNFTNVTANCTELETGVYSIEVDYNVTTDDPLTECTAV
jgi:hypothetical protein